MNTDLGFSSWSDFLQAWLHTCLALVQDTAHNLLAPPTFTWHLLQVLVLIFALLATTAWIHDKGRFTDLDGPILTEADRLDNTAPRG